jgi:N-acetylglucosamine-6-phosphate deacetylase|tara:strand:+ start:2816 stop:3136 length:321 start_codon:yes stop_codon:yes gene_type:complete
MPSYKNLTTGSIDANAETVTHACRLLAPGAISVQIAGTFSGTLQLEATVDGTNFSAYSLSDGNSATLATAATAVKIFVGDAFAIQSFRVRASAWSSGTANITIATL